MLGVEHYELPAGVIALLGMAEIRRLGMSLHFIADNPGCSWEVAVRPTRPELRPQFVAKNSRVLSAPTGPSVA